MAIATLDQYIAAAKQRITWVKTTSRTSVAAMPESLFNVAGNPGAGVWDQQNTTPGLVHTDAYAGYPPINAFGGGATGYLSKVEFGNTVACRIDLYDRLYVSGPYAYNASAGVSSPPSYASRVPGGTDFTGLQLWFEALTAFTGNLSLVCPLYQSSWRGRPNRWNHSYRRRPDHWEVYSAPPSSGRFWNHGTQKRDRVRVHCGYLQHHDPPAPVVRSSHGGQRWGQPRFTANGHGSSLCRQRPLCVGDSRLHGVWHPLDEHRSGERLNDKHLEETAGPEDPFT